MASYQIRYHDPYGNLLEVWREITRLELVRKENEVGILTLTMPRNVDKSILRADARLEVWRTVGASTKLVGQTAWFLEDWEINAQTMTLYAYDANWLLEGRITAYASGTTNVSFTTCAADNVMKAVVRSNLTTDAIAARDISTWLAVDPDFTLGQETTVSVSRRNVMRVLQQLAEDSRERGTYLAFDTEYVDAKSLIFKTYTTCRGVNHGRNSGNPVVLSEWRKNLEDATYIERHYKERTYVYAGGQGTEESRMVEEAEDTTRSGRSPFGRREAWVDARMSSTSDSLLSEAKAELELNQPEIMLTGRIVETPGTQFGINYDFGDIVVAEFEGYSFDAHVDTLHIIYEGGNERIDNRIKGYL